MTTVSVAPQTVPTLREVARRVPQWLRHHTLAALTSVVVGGVFGYVLNVWLIAVRYQGADKVPPNAPATSYGNFFQGALFWGLATTVLFGAFGYWHAVGTRQFLADLRGLPRALGALLRGDRAAGVHLLWGAAVALLAAQVVPPAAGAVLAVGLLAAAPGVVGSIVSAFLYRIWSALVRSVAPTRGHWIGGITGMTVGLLGSATALVVASLVSDGRVKWILAGVLALAALLVGLTRRPSASTLILLFLGAALLAHGLTDALPAHANDGGTLECTGQAWLQCSGSGTVLRNSVVGGSAAAAGGILGSFIGDLAGTLGGGPEDQGPLGEPSPDTPPDDRKAINDWIRGLLTDPAFPRWRATHPGFTGSPTDGEFNQYLSWRRARGLADPPLLLPSQQAPPLVDAGALPPLSPDSAGPPPDLPPPDLPLGPDLVPDASGSVKDTKVISGDEALRRLWAAQDALHPGQPFNPAGVIAPSGNMPPGIQGGAYTTRPDGTVDPDQPIALAVDWPHPAAPPATDWLTPPRGGFDGDTLKHKLWTQYGLQLQPLTGSDGRTYLRAPDNLPDHWAGAAYGTKSVDGVSVIDPNSPIVINQWPPFPPGTPPAVPWPQLPPTPPPGIPPVPQPQPPPVPVPQPAPAPTPPPPPDGKDTPSDDADKAARRAEMQAQQARRQAASDSLTRASNIWDATKTPTEILDALGHLADLGVNILSNFVPGWGQTFNYGYTTVKAVSGGWAEGQSGPEILTHVAFDNALNYGFNKLGDKLPLPALRGWDPRAAGPAKQQLQVLKNVGLGTGNTIAGQATDKKINDAFK
ncbi:hypothetical protein [Streptomyces collinus]|uniref:hypothetical protein n=1 Tax=Streptomyces collinus TaxID=42684 RepID=UPI0029435D77|nr:hypothetical protein [Streptomyces collinus]